MKSSQPASPAEAAAADDEGISPDIESALAALMGGDGGDEDGAPEDAPDASPMAFDDDDEAAAADDDGGELSPFDDDNEDEESADDDSDENDDPAALRLPEKFRARLDKLKGQRDGLRTELATEKEARAALEARLEAAEQEPVLLTPTADNPLSNTRDLQELDAAAAHWQKLLDWADENEDGGVMQDAAGRDVELDRKQVRALRKNAQTLIDRHVPARRAYFEARAKHVKAVKATYPFMLKPDHPGTKFAASLVTDTGLARRPDYELVAGDAYVGRLIRQGLATAVRDGKTGEVKLMKVAPASAAAAGQQQRKKPPVRAATGGPPVKPAGDRSGRAAAALRNADPMAALEALLGDAA